jgi:hypothetical protein
MAKATSYYHTPEEAMEWFHDNYGPILHIRVDRSHMGNPDYEYWRIVQSHSTVLKIKPRTLKISVITKSSCRWLFNDNWAKQLHICTAREYNEVAGNIIDKLNQHLKTEK